jgi:hypothetical protein
VRPCLSEWRRSWTRFTYFFLSGGDARRLRRTVVVAFSPASYTVPDGSAHTASPPGGHFPSRSVEQLFPEADVANECRLGVPFIRASFNRRSGRQSVFSQRYIIFQNNSRLFRSFKPLGASDYRLRNPIPECPVAGADVSFSVKKFRLKQLRHGEIREATFRSVHLLHSVNKNYDIRKIYSKIYYYFIYAIIPPPIRCSLIPRVFGKNIR